MLERTAGWRIDGQTLELLDAAGTPGDGRPWRSSQAVTISAIY